MTALPNFSAGFAWCEDVAEDATPRATPMREAAKPLSQTNATLHATAQKVGNSDLLAAGANTVATVATVADACRLTAVRRPVADTVEVAATFSATVKSAVFCGVAETTGPAVANVASVATWTAGVELMLNSRGPTALSHMEWLALGIGARQLLQDWGADFVALGWTTLEVFGVNPDPRTRGKGRRGLVQLLGGRPVEAIDRDTALIRHSAADTMTFQRKLVIPGGLPVWNWALANAGQPVGEGVRGSAYSATPAHPYLSTGVGGTG